MPTSGSSQQSSQSTPTLLPILDDPRLGGLFNNIQGMIPTSLPSVNDIVAGGMNSPLLAQILGPALARLMPSEADSRQAVTDAARSAGSLRSTAYGQSVARNEGNILQNRGSLISDTIAKMLGPLLQATLTEQQNSFLPARTGIDLLQAGRPLSGQQSSSTGFSNYGGTGSDSGGIGFSGDPGLNDWLRRIGYQPTSYGGSGSTGVNAPTGGGSPISAPPPNPYGGYGLEGGAGGAGGYGITYNPQSGSYESDPFAGGGYNTGYGAVGYQQGYDEFGNPV